MYKCLSDKSDERRLMYIIIYKEYAISKNDNSKKYNKYLIRELCVNWNYCYWSYGYSVALCGK